MLDTEKKSGFEQGRFPLKALLILFFISGGFDRVG